MKTLILLLTLILMAPTIAYSAGAAWTQQDTCPNIAVPNILHPLYISAPAGSPAHHPDAEITYVSWNYAYSWYPATLDAYIGVVGEKEGKISNPGFGQASSFFDGLSPGHMYFRFNVDQQETISPPMYGQVCVITVNYTYPTSCNVGLDTIINGLKVLTGEPNTTVSCADTNNDGKIGMDDIIKLMQTLGEKGE